MPIWARVDHYDAPWPEFTWNESSRSSHYVLFFSGYC